MAKRGRRTGGGTLAGLERELAQLNARRHQIVQQIQAAVNHLTHGSAASMSGPSLTRGAGGGSRTVSPAVRARLSALAKARWAKAKREGKKRLG